MNIWTIVALFVGFILGIFIASLGASSKISDLQNRASYLQKENERLRDLKGKSE